MEIAVVGEYDIGAAAVPVHVDVDVARGSTHATKREDLTEFFRPSRRKMEDWPNFLLFRNECLKFLVEGYAFDKH
jgi:hypothetical protein